MQRQRLQLPPLQEPIKSSRISNFEDYAKWQKQKKQAYRDELRHEILEHDLSRESRMREKEKDRTEINTIVKDEQHRRDVDRHAKIKTEQKYMLDNWNMIQQSQRVIPPKMLHNLQENYREHPFVILSDQDQERRTETKNNFVFQNQLNDIQREMRKEEGIKRKMFESQERKRYDEHVEEEYRKKRRDRVNFENKYLKVDKTSGSDCKKEYLEYLKAQVNLNHSHHKRIREEVTLSRASPGHIGLSPAQFDRTKQLETIEKSLKMFPESSRNNSSLLDSISKSDAKNQFSIRKSPYEKVVTERAAPAVKGNYHLQTLQLNPSKEDVHPIQSQLSQRMERPSRMRKEYKHYDIISGNERYFVN